jgi:hypothetical protein
MKSVFAFAAALLFMGEAIAQNPEQDASYDCTFLERHGAFAESENDPQKLWGFSRQVDPWSIILRTGVAGGAGSLSYRAGGSMQTEPAFVSFGRNGSLHFRQDNNGLSILTSVFPHQGRLLAAHTRHVMPLGQASGPGSNPSVSTTFGICTKR